MELPPRATLFDFNGVSMIKYFTDNWDNIQKFQARPDDILIATFPKSGTTWVSYILYLLYFGKTNQEHQTSIPIHERVPFLESNVPFQAIGKDLADNSTATPRLIKTHFPVQFVPKSFFEQKCKIVSVFRNPKDTAVSYFHFGRMNQLQPEPGDWSTFLQKFMKGKVVYGPWYDHVNGWWDKRQTYSNLHFMFYEDLSLDCGQEIARLCSFLGLSPSSKEREQVINGARFENMKHNKITNYSSLRIMDQTVSPFMRKGKVGDWKNHFTVAQNEEFNEDYKKKMKNSTLMFRTEI